MTLALVLQLSGFILAIAALVLHWSHLDFVAAFGVHVAGDALFIAKEGIPLPGFSKLKQFFLSHVKLLPWSQFAFTMLALLSLLEFAKGPHRTLAHAAFLAATGIASVAFVAGLKKAPDKPVSERHLLQGGGLGVALALGAKLNPALATLAFVALAVSQAGQWYDEIYP